MSTAAITLQESQPVWKLPLAKPLDEAVWQAWIAKGRAQDLRGSNMRAKAVKWAAIMVLVAAALLSSRVAPYEVVVRFIVAAGALVVMFHAFRARRHAWAIVFGALAVLFNPILPVLSFSADWQRAVVVASAVPFAASLAWRNLKTARHD